MRSNKSGARQGREFASVICRARGALIAIALGLGLGEWSTCTAETPAKGDFYVATNGNDTWSGRLEEPNLALTDGPFKSLTRARDQVRQLRRNPLERNIVLWIRGGCYRLEQTLILGL